MWGGRHPTAEEAEQLTQCFVYEWTQAVRQDAPTLARGTHLPIMASSSNPAQTHSLNTPSTQYQSQAESEIYNLDGPFLVRKVLNQHPKVAGSITCRFLAIPLNAPQASSYDIAQHGHVSHESKDKLIMRVPSQ
ncbi:hypothetical protein NUW58_g10914 [Xylaria curta]|uniref:Uncharacterized protein n=1 Tax=Xylaria curta TaxID=42375 RepID=A0ACC1ME61_9PEZI|nr:hypothetical protein NUW58_g10914 [Xylaria curta]